MWPLIGLGLLFQGASTALGAAKDAEAAQAQASYNKMVSNFNANLDDLGAEDAITQGETAARDIEAEGKKVRSAQRASYAGQGVESDAGSAVDVAADTQAAIAKDQLTVRNNAWRKAWGYKVEAFKQRTAGNFGQQTANNVAGNTMLTGGIKAFGDLTTGFGKLYSDWG